MADTFCCPKHACVACFDTDRKLRGHLGGKHYRTVPERLPIEHGTPRGYRAHQRRDETPCQTCRAGWAAYIANRRRTKP